MVEWEESSMMLKKDLTDCTFIIPFRDEMPDSFDRFINLELVINYLLHHFYTNIIVYESGLYYTLDAHWNVRGKFNDYWHEQVRSFFRREKRDIFHKTLLLNYAIKHCKTDIIISNDADCIVPPNQYIKAINSIRNKKYSFCYPFNSETVNVPKDKIKTIYYKKFNMKKIGIELPTLTKEKEVHIAPGGCFVFDKKEFKKVGNENEKFINYGFEDAERKARIEILGYKINYIKGYLFHIEHDKGIVSTPEN